MKTEDLKAADISDEDLITLLEARGYRVVRANEQWDPWVRLGPKVNGRDIYENRYTDEYAVEYDHAYLKTPNEEEQKQIDELLGK